MGDIIKLENLKNDMCKWPIGDPQESDFRFCGCKKPADNPYCTNHQRMAYRKYTGPAKRAA